tara:strand:+ start:1415 stop:1774 length:360 start_codon:yes stop_codon:yes gene_type:complete
MKKSFFSTVEEFLAKFDTVTWIGQDGSKLIGKLDTGEEITFSLSSKYASNHYDIDSMPVQVVARVTIDGEYASSWGACSGAECSSLVRYYRVNEARAQQIEHSLDREAIELAEQKWELL